MDEGIITLFVMTLGEMDAVNSYVYPPAKKDPFRMDIIVLLAVFIFLMTIVLVNLMVGMIYIIYFVKLGNAFPIEFLARPNFPLSRV